MAWALAKRGLRVAVIERTRFPREKVCGDFVEPAGLRIFEAMGCRQALEKSSPLPITHTTVFLQSQIAYRGEIPYYERKLDLREGVGGAAISDDEVSVVIHIPVSGLGNGRAQDDQQGCDHC